MTDAQSIDRPRRLFRDSLLHKEAASPADAGAAATPIFAERPVARILLPLIALMIWALTHCYPGLIGDGAVYIARVLADFDPNGVGRDMMFVHDGQSQYSLFPILLDHLVPAIGTERTGLLLAFVSMAGWTAALAYFAKHYGLRYFISVVIIFVALLPVNYGAPMRFGFSEVLTVARPFSEALVIAALAALAAQRTWLGFAFLVLSSLIHPLMVLPGWCVFVLVLSRENWRWCAFFVAVGVLFVVGALAGVPVLHHLTELMDPSLKQFALSRSPLLFPTAWPTEYLGAVFAEVAALAIAASLYARRLRWILIGAIVAGISGIAAQSLFGDILSLLLVIQAQLWRMAWLMAALGSVALALCALRLWRQGPCAHIVLALLSVAWISNDAPVSAGLLAAAALGLHSFQTRLPAFNWKIAALVWAYACIVALILNIHYVTGYAGFLHHMPAEAPRGLEYFWARRYVAFPVLGLLLVVVFSRKAAPLVAAGTIVTALLLAILCVRLWDARAPFQKLIDAAKHPPELTALIDSRPGEILWVDGLTEAWYLAGRPQWASQQQGVSTVFSAELAQEFGERMRFLIAEGLAEKSALSNFKIPSKDDLPVVTKENVAHLCARPDAPVWIVMPVSQGTIIPPGLGAHEWRPSEPSFKMTEEPLTYDWQKIDAYAVLPCAPEAKEAR
ncbi:MAG: hypothetical protein ABSC72_02385 [Methylovirgula sp.]|jgi:hypothetical protein